MRRFLLAVVVALGVLALGSLARPAPPAHPERIAPLFALLDLDGDGRIGPDEATRVGSPDLDFAALDLDGSGALSPGEVEVSLWTLDPAWWVRGPN